MGKEIKSINFCKIATIFVLLAALAAAGMRFSINAEEPFPETELAAALRQFQSTYSHFQKGKSLFADNKLDQAARQFEACTATMPAHVYARYYLANIYYLQKKFAQAEAEITSAENQLDFMMAIDASAQKSKVREMEDTAQNLEKSYDATGICMEHRKIEAISLDIARETEKARKEYSREILFQRKMRSDYLFFHGNILFQQQKYDQALEIFKRAITTDPQNGNAYNNIIAIYYLAGRHADADRYLSEAEQAGIGDLVNLKLKELIFAALGRPTTGILQQEYGMTEQERLRVIRFSANVFENEPNRPPLFANSYIAFDRESRDAVLIDPGTIDPRIENFVKDRNLRIRLILNTHGHHDHCNGNMHYAGLFGAKIAISSGDEAFYKEKSPKRGGKADLVFLAAEQTAGSIVIHVIPTPGHTSGCACFLIGCYLFSGDSLFLKTIGRIPADDNEEYRQKSRKLIQQLTAMTATLPPQTELLPGHGPSAALAFVREVNPFLKEVN